jgi:hypothetical protein
MAVILYALIGGPRNKANADLIRNAIQNSADPVGSWVKYGRVNLDDAMEEINPPTDPPTITGISPSNVQAYKGGTITINGSGFNSAEQVNSGGNILLPPDGFTIVNDTTITYQAPMASNLGSTAVTVSNVVGPSNPGYFNYVETDPPKLGALFIASGGQDFDWTYGAGANDTFYLLVATDNTTFNYKGYPILSYFIVLTQGSLNAAGTGITTIYLPSGFPGFTFYSEVITFDCQTWYFDGATNITTTMMLN